MITLCYRGGAGGHVVAALLDYCTVEGGLDGFPDFEVGNNLHTHYSAHVEKKNDFYAVKLHELPDAVWYKSEDGKTFNDPDTVPKQFHLGKDIISPVACDDLSRILVLTMAFGKTRNKKLPPDDSRLDYTGLETLGEKIEKIAFMISDSLALGFEGFHGHYYPKYMLDINWLHNNEHQKISDTIRSCGWTPLEHKIESFCKQVAIFNKPYTDIVNHCNVVYNQILNQISRPCTMTVYETAVVHGLLLSHYKITDPNNTKIISKLPTSTAEFFELYST